MCVHVGKSKKEREKSEERKQEKSTYITFPRIDVDKLIESGLHHVCPANCSIIGKNE